MDGLSSIDDYLNEIFRPSFTSPHSRDANQFYLPTTLVYEKVWWYRNEPVLNGTMHDAHHAITSLQSRFAEFASSMSAPLQNRSSVPTFRMQPPKSLVWSPPQHNLVKLNVDVSIKNGRCFASLVGHGARGTILHLQTDK